MVEIYLNFNSFCSKWKYLLVEEKIVLVVAAFEFIENEELEKEGYPTTKERLLELLDENYVDFVREYHVKIFASFFSI